MCDRPEAIRLVLAVQREVHTDVVACLVTQRRVAGPRRRDHDRRARRDPVTQRTVDTDVRGMAGTEVVAGDDDQLGIVVVAETSGEGGHRSGGYPVHLAHRPM
jgi:hypothetical protein